MKKPKRPKHGECPLCRRFCELTFHHLIPKKLHRRTFFRKKYDRDRLNAGLDICRLCHDGIHDRYDEMTLARQCATLDDLRADPALARHFEWVARQKTAF